MSGKPIDEAVDGEDDALTLADVAGVLGEIAEGFDGGEYAVSDETRRVLIDFANGLPEHPLFNIVGHYFAQHPVRTTAAQQQGQAVAWMRRTATYRSVDGRSEGERIVSEKQVYPDDIPLYTAPPSAPVDSEPDCPHSALDGCDCYATQHQEPTT